jgi:heme exporter protein B
MADSQESKYTGLKPLQEASVPPSLWVVFVGQLKRDLLLAFRHRSDIANPLIFFVMVIALFPLGISPAPDKLAVLAPGLLWVVALLASLLATDGLFRHDYEDGSLELMLTSPQPLYVLSIAKVLSHWLVTGVPLTVIAPVLAVMVYLPEEGMLPLCFSLGLGSLSLSFVGAIGAALTVGLRNSGVLMSLIVLPLYTPVLIFGSSSVQSAIDGFAYHGQLAMLGAFLLLAITLAPFAIVAGLRISVDG